MHGRYAARLIGAAIGLGLVGIATLAMAPSASAHVRLAGHVIVRTQEPVVTISPDVAEPGDSVEIDTAGCGFDSSATASSPAFEHSIDLTPVEQATRLVGSATVDQHAEPGQYTVSVECVADTTPITGQLRVVPPSGPNTGGGGLASTDGTGQGLTGTPTGGIARGTGTGGLPAGQGPAVVAMLVIGALTGAVVGLRAHRRNPGPS